MKYTRWLIPVILVLLVATTVMSALAYFNSDKTTTGTIHSGTLELLLSKDGNNFGGSVGTPWDVPNMKPGDEVSGKLYMKITGSINSKQVTFDLGNIINDPTNKALAEQIFLTHVWDSKNQSDAIVQVTTMSDTNSDGKTSLAELAALSGRFGLPYDAVSDVDPLPPCWQHAVALHGFPVQS